MAFSSGIRWVPIERALHQKSVRGIQLGAARSLWGCRPVAELPGAFPPPWSRPSHRGFHQGQTVQLVLHLFTSQLGIIEAEQARLHLPSTKQHLEVWRLAPERTVSTLVRLVTQSRGHLQALV